MKAPTRLTLAQHNVVYYQHQLAEGESMDDVMNPAYWVHVTQYLKPGFRVMILAHDLTWTAELMCRGVSEHSAKMGLVSHVEFGAKESVLADDAPLTVKWAGPKAKWRVVRASDNEVLRSGIDVKEDAEAWAVDHMKDMAA